MTKLQLSILVLCCASCSIEDELLRAQPNKLAEVETSDGQRVEFLALRSGGAAFAVSGPAGAEPIDFDALMSKHGGAAGAYRALSGREAPAALQEAANHPSLVGDESRLELAPPPPAQESSGSEVAASRAAIEWYPSDLTATQWKNTHCPLLASLLKFDGCRTKTNVAEVTTDYRDTKYYAVGLQANGGADAFLRVHRWNGSDWEVVLYQKVPAGSAYAGVFLDNGAYYKTEAWSRSGTQGKIHFYEKYRLSIAVPSFIDNKPSNVSYDFSNDISGITHDENNWFLTRTRWSLGSPNGGTIAKVPFTRYLGNEPQIIRDMPGSWKYQEPQNCMPCEIPPGEQCCERPQRYTHFGDLVRRGQYLFVGMDGLAGAAIGIFDTNLNPMGFAPLSHNSKAPFVAYNPRSGYFYVPSGGNTLEKYVVSEASILAGAPEAVWDSTQMLSQVFSNFQGGKFSPNGNLWILNGYDGKNREFWGIDGVSGLTQVKGGLSPGAADESEGVDIIDLDTETRPGLSGQLHLQMLQNNPIADDDWWFMHWRAPMNRL